MGSGVGGGGEGGRRARTVVAMKKLTRYVICITLPLHTLDCALLPVSFSMDAVTADLYQVHCLDHCTAYKRTRHPYYRPNSALNSRSALHSLSAFLRQVRTSLDGG